MGDSPRRNSSEDSIPMRPHVIRLASAALVALVVAGAASFAFAAPQLVRTLPNKMTLIVRENRTRPAVAIQVWVRAGTRDEGRSERGAASVLAQLPWEGNANRSSDDIDRVASMVGGRYSGEVSNATILYEMDLPARSFKQGIETLGDIVLHPSFDAKPVENAKSHARTASRNALGHAALASMNPLRDALHPANTLGAPASVPELEIGSLTATLVSRFHKAWFTGDNILVVVAGDVDPEEAAATVAAAFASVPTSKSPGRSRSTEKPLSGTKVLNLTNPEGTGGAASTIGFRAPAAGSADALALDALLALLADYSDARIQRRLGEASFLHGASARRSFEADGGTVALSMAAAPENLVDADAILLAEIERARFTPVEDDEFRHTVDAMIARDLVVQGDLAGIARVTAYGAMQVKPGSDEVYAARLRALKKEDLVAVARQYLDPKQAVIVHMAP